MQRSGLCEVGYQKVLRSACDAGGCERQFMSEALGVRMWRSELRGRADVTMRVVRGSLRTVLGMRL